MSKNLFVAAAVVLFSGSALADSCYRFEMQESAAMSAIPILSTETWCYREMPNPVGSVFIYNADSDRAKAELAAIVEPDGVVTHASLNKGKLTTHKVNGADLNPLPVPLTEPAHLIPRTEDSDVDVSDALNVLLRTRSADVPNLSVEEGTFEATVPSANLPWRGFWWSYKSNALAGTSNSPLAKYDRYVQARTGIMPRVASWERTYHKYKGISWEGHCNGWAASAVLRAEPKTSKIYAPTGLVFSVSDQKGILAEEDYCAVVAFYGTRNYGKASNNPRDIHPQDFHKVLSYYIGQLGKVVAIDYFASRTVDNHLVSGYTFDIVRKNADTFTVSAKLTVHKYDSSYKMAPGIAPTYIRNYKYNLRVNSAGTITGGSWISANPDFLWVPLSPTDCSSNNPRMKQELVNEILRLPPISM